MPISDQSRARKTYSFFRSQPVVQKSTSINVGPGLIVSSSNGVIFITTQVSGAMSGSGGTFKVADANFIVSPGSFDLV